MNYTITIEEENTNNEIYYIGRVKEFPYITFVNKTSKEDAINQIENVLNGKDISKLLEKYKDDNKFDKIETKTSLQ